MMLTLFSFTVFVYKLFPKTLWRPSDDQLQRGMRGTVTTYGLNVDNVASMADGTLMPQPFPSWRVSYL